MDATHVHCGQWRYMTSLAGSSLQPLGHESLQSGRKSFAHGRWRRPPVLAGLKWVASSEAGAGKGKSGHAASSQAALRASVRDPTLGPPFARLSESVQDAPSSHQSGSSGYPNSPLLWVGVGVGVTLVFARIAGWMKTRVQQIAMEQMMKALSTQGGAPFGGVPSQFGASPGVGAFAPPDMQSGPSSTSRPATSSATIDTTAVPSQAREERQAEDSQSKPKRSSAFRDIDRDELEQQQQQAQRKTATAFKDAEVVDNTNGSGFRGQAAPGGGITMEMLEKMLGDPTIQNMLMQYLPDNMKDPQTLKWVLQNPVYKKQLEEALLSMNKDGGSWDPRVVETFNKLDLNSDEMKKQFDQIGMTPEQLVTMVMSDPKMAESLQNPKFQAAILDCAQDPLNMLKYRNDSEIMEVFNKMQTLFPNMG